MFPNCLEPGRVKAGGRFPSDQLDQLLMRPIACLYENLLGYPRVASSLGGTISLIASVRWSSLPWPACFWPTCPKSPPKPACSTFR